MKPYASLLAGIWSAFIHSWKVLWLSACVLLLCVPLPSGAPLFEGGLSALGRVQVLLLLAVGVDPSGSGLRTHDPRTDYVEIELTIG